MNQTSHRMEKVDRELRELSSRYFIQSGRTFPGVLITVSRAEASKDLRHAKVFLSLMGEATDERFEELKEHEGELGRFIGKNLTTKYSPKITLIWDKGFEAMSSVQSTLDKVRPDSDE